MCNSLKITWAKKVTLSGKLLVINLKKRFCYRNSSTCILFYRVFFRYEPSKADVDTFSAIQPPQAKTPNVLRWYNHIKSFSDKERAQFPNKKAEFSTTSGSVSKPAAAADDDDDDVDLFGSDDEEVINLI